MQYQSAWGRLARHTLVGLFLSAAAGSSALAQSSCLYVNTLSTVGCEIVSFKVDPTGVLTPVPVCPPVDPLVTQLFAGISPQRPEELEVPPGANTVVTFARGSQNLVAAINRDRDQLFTYRDAGSCSLSRIQVIDYPACSGGTAGRVQNVVATRSRGGAQYVYTAASECGEIRGWEVTSSGLVELGDSPYTTFSGLPLHAMDLYDPDEDSALPILIGSSPDSGTLETYVVNPTGSLELGASVPADSPNGTLAALDVTTDTGFTSPTVAVGYDSDAAGELSLFSIVDGTGDLIPFTGGPIDIGLSDAQFPVFRDGPPLPGDADRRPPPPPIWVGRKALDLLSCIVINQAGDPTQLGGDLGGFICPTSGSGGIVPGGGGVGNEFFWVLNAAGTNGPTVDTLEAEGDGTLLPLFTTPVDAAGPARPVGLAFQE